jgi:hypothetical protein
LAAASAESVGPPPCGPIVVVEEVRKRCEAEGIRFIHIEIYKDNLPGKGVNQWVAA